MGQAGNTPFTKIKNTLYLPAIKRLVLRRIHATRYHRQHKQLGTNAPFEGEIVWVNPLEIAGHMNVSVGKSLKKRTGFDGGTVLGGDWDIEFIEYMSFTSVDPFTSCYDRWIGGRNWDELPQFKKYVLRLQRGEACRFASYTELQNRYNKLDEIFRSVTREGKMSMKKEDLVRVSIARDGRLIWGPDGKHRICIAILAGLKRMPAQLGFVHCEAVQRLPSLRARE